jgi:hypothetical protein
METLSPAWILPIMERVEPNLKRLLTEHELPKVKNSQVDVDEPNRMKLLRLKAEARLTKSKMDMFDPTRVQALRDNVLPN